MHIQKAKPLRKPSDGGKMTVVCIVKTSFCATTRVISITSSASIATTIWTSTTWSIASKSNCKQQGKPLRANSVSPRRSA